MFSHFNTIKLLSILFLAAALFGCGGSSKSSGSAQPENTTPENPSPEPKPEPVVLAASEFKSGQWLVSHFIKSDFSVWSETNSRYERIVLTLAKGTNLDIVGNGVSGKAKVSRIQNGDAGINLDETLQGVSYQGFTIGDDITITGAVIASNLHLKLTTSSGLTSSALYGIYDRDVIIVDDVFTEASMQGVFFVDDNSLKAGEGYVSLKHVGDSELTAIDADVVDISTLKQQSSVFADGQYSGELSMYIAGRGEVDTGDYLDTEVMVELTFDGATFNGTGVFTTPDGLPGITANDPVTLSGTVNGNLYEFILTHAASGWVYRGIGSATGDIMLDENNKITGFETDYGAGFPTSTTYSSEFELEISLDVVE